MRRVAFVLVVCVGTLFGSSARIAVAANVSYAIEALKSAFVHAHPTSNLQISLGSSGKLSAQIQNGAPYDLFLSADMKYPKALYKEGMALSQPVVYAQGSLSLLSVRPRDFSKNIALLVAPSIQKVAVANPKTAPYGKAALEALRNAHIYMQIRSKLLYGESVSQTLLYTLKAADVGIVATSLLYAPQMKRYIHGRNWVEVDSSLYKPIEQGMILLRHAKRNKTAEEFFAFMQSPQAVEILRSFGYQNP